MSDNPPSQPEVVIERTLDPPPAVVRKMWTEPEHFKAWCGPDGAAIPVARMDVRVGDTRLVCMEMQTPDGSMQMRFTGTTEIVVELEDLGGRTKMVMTHVGVPEDSPGAAGWTMAFDKLAAHLGRATGRDPDANERR